MARAVWLVGGVTFVLACAHERPPTPAAPPSDPAPAPVASGSSLAAPSPTATDAGDGAAEAGTEAVEPLADVELVAIDTSRWAGEQCHPAERWDDDRGCVPKPGAPAVRCGSERVSRITCDCAVSDLLCVMRCARLSKPRMKPHWAEPAPKKEQADCRRQCRVNHAPSCLHLGNGLLQTGDAAAGVAAVDKSCRLGYADACEKLFSLYESVPEARSFRLAARLAESDCARSVSDEEACARAARAYESGWGVPVDTAKAERYRQRACAMVKARCQKSAERYADAGPAKHDCIDFVHACEPR